MRAVSAGGCRSCSTTADVPVAGLSTHTPVSYITPQSQLQRELQHRFVLSTCAHRIWPVTMILERVLQLSRNTMLPSGQRWLGRCTHANMTQQRKSEHTQPNTKSPAALTCLNQRVRRTGRNVGSNENACGGQARTDYAVQESFAAAVLAHGHQRRRKCRVHACQGKHA